MPPELIKAHYVLNSVADAACRRKFIDNFDRVALLFGSYQKLTEEGRRRRVQDL